MNFPLLRKPSAYLPLFMSLAILIVVLVHVTLFGTTREADEGAAAHLFQILLVAQALVAAYFAVRWLPKSPRQGACVLALQGLTLLAACTPIAVMGL
jgi:glucan phosphoethanolaminetransferase (alkaline phosphatase superfamily)